VPFRFEHEGLALWYGGDDTPAPTGDQPGQPDPLLIAVAPAHPFNTVTVRYRVDGGLVRTLPAVELVAERRPDRQRFRASFPRLPEGSTVEYAVLLGSAGRQVPPPAAAIGLGPAPARFRVAPGSPLPANDTDVRPCFSYTQELLTTVAVQLADPELIGETPDGLKVNWWVKAGSFRGPRLNGVIRAEGADFMTIRRDGIGSIDVRAVFQTDDGALITANYGGVFELGPEGYRNFLQGRFPEAPTMRGAPRYITADARYLWLNRLQCLAVGQVDVGARSVRYDVHAVH
jgi:hypothetical protein